MISIRGIVNRFHCGLELIKISIRGSSSDFFSFSFDLILIEKRISHQISQQIHGFLEVFLGDGEGEVGGFSGNIAFEGGSEGF